MCTIPTKASISFFFLHEGKTTIIHINQLNLHLVTHILKAPNRHAENENIKEISLCSARHKQKRMKWINAYKDVYKFLDSHDSGHTSHQRSKFVYLYLLMHISTKYTSQVSIWVIKKIKNTYGK